ncbi:MAG: biopolymer transporter ExbB [Pseudomonadota bacterium]
MILDHEQDPSFSQPIRQIILMVLILVLVAVGVYFIYREVAPIFAANLYLNGFICAVFVVGVLACFWQVLQLVSAVSWIEGFALNRPGHEFVQSPRLLTSLAAQLKDKRARSGIPSASARGILESVATRLDEARDITRYIINLLIFLGLLGTFYGLATSVPAVVDTIRSLTPEQGGEVTGNVFQRLLSGIEAQLGGMGTAFASSLLGLAGSLIVGILELFAGHGQNRFYMELENWLSSITRIRVGAEGSDAATGYAEEILEQTSAQMATLQASIDTYENSRAQMDQKLDTLIEAVSVIAQQMGANSAGSLDRLAIAQERLADLIEQREHAAHSFDEEARTRLRNMDTQLLRILEEMSAGRQDAVSDLRTEIGALTDALTRRG